MKPAAFLACWFAFAPLARGQATAPPSSPRPSPARAITPTRTAVLFGGLERELVEAIRRKDRTALGRLLTDDFELRGNVHPGEPVPRDEWQDAVFAGPLDSFQLSETAVHMAGDDTAIVSFAYEQQAKPPAPSGRFSFVDVWRRQAGQWRLDVRYAAPATEAPVPGLVAVEPEIPKKY
jgi:ketosteroid isomerase-like protein